MTDAGKIAPADLRCVRHRAISTIADAWDRFVPRDLPHLRAGFLEAVERGRMLEDLEYFLAYRGDDLAGLAVAYTLPWDTAASMPPTARRIVAGIRKLLKGFLWKPMRICGSPISNAESGVYLCPRLADHERRGAFLFLADEILAAGGSKPTYFFKEFDQPAVVAYAGELESLGFFANDPWSGTRLDLAWSRFEDYLAALKKRYRKRVRQDVQLAEKELEFELVDSFADLAPQAHSLYDRVFTKASFALERGTREFFAALSDFDQAQLLVARHRASGEVVGVNLLLFGDTCMHNLYIGFDYELNERLHIYFNLVIQSLRVAMERSIKVCFLGQDSYEFKARLGARPFGLTAYMKHRLKPVHAMLKAQRHVFFPKNEPVTHDVFQGSGAAEE